MYLYYMYMQNISPAEWFMFSKSLEIKLVEVICRNFTAIPKANSGECFITVGLKTDGLSVPSPVQDPAPGLGSG